MSTNNLTQDEYSISYKVIKNESNEFIIVGSFTIKEIENYNLHKKLQSAIVMVISTPNSFHTIMPFQNTVIFKDDVKRTNNKILGEFVLNFSEIVSSMKSPRFNVLFSLGAYTSNIETIKL